MYESRAPMHVMCCHVMYDFVRAFYKLKCLFSYLGGKIKISIICRFKLSVLKIATSLLITSFPRIFYKGFCTCLSWSWHDQVRSGCGAPCLRAAGLHSALADCVANGNERAPPRFPRQSDFLSSELLIWPHRRPPHWDYLVICSSNFYEVDFPHILILFQFVLYAVAIWGGLPSSDFCTLK